MADIKKVFTRLIEELDKEERDELLEEMKGRKLTGAELLEAIKELDPESRKAVREALAEARETVDDDDNNDDDDKTKPKPKPKPTNDNDDDDDDKKKKKPKTRPGRKSGRAYGWWIDENGKVIQLDVARVYSGEDEPDEVELYPDDDDDDDDDNDGDE